MSCNYKKRQALFWQWDGDRDLIVPAVGTSSDLDPIGQAVSTTQEVGTEFGDIVGSSVIQADNE